MSESAASRRRWVFVAIASVLGLGILYLHWRDATEPIPEFGELRQISSASLKYERACKNSCRLVFHDGDTRSFETRYLPRTDVARIEALLRERDLTLYYGRWDSPFPSEKIFSIYHIESDLGVVLDYAGSAEVAARGQSAATPVLLLSTAVLGVAVFLGVRLGTSLRARFRA